MEFRYSAGTRRSLTGAVAIQWALATLLGVGVLWAASEGRPIAGYVAFALLGIATGALLLPMRVWAGRNIAVHRECLEFAGSRGILRLPWATVESIRFHRLSIAGVPYFSIRGGGRRQAARIYLSVEDVGALLEAIAIKTPAAKPTVELPMMFERRSWAGAGLRLVAALVPVAYLAVFLSQKGADVMAWSFAVVGALVGALYLAILYISPIRTTIDHAGILVERRFKGNIDLRFDAIEEIRLCLPFGKSAGGPRVMVFPRAREPLFLDVPADRCLPLFRLLKGLTEDLGSSAGARRRPALS